MEMTSSSVPVCRQGLFLHTGNSLVRDHALSRERLLHMGQLNLAHSDLRYCSRLCQLVPLAPPHCHGVTKLLPPSPVSPTRWFDMLPSNLQQASATFISTGFPLMKYLPCSHTATSLVFAFKATMWKSGLWFWYIHCSWICYEQNLYLNICYKLINENTELHYFFVVVTNLTLPDFKQVP